MTNSPEATTPDSRLTTTEQEPADAGEPVTASDVLDRDTYDEIREPRSASRLPLGDGTWHQIARQYVWVQLISTGVFAAHRAGGRAAGHAAVGAVVGVDPGRDLPRHPGVDHDHHSRGRRARSATSCGDDDLVFRRGILWQRVVAVPYGRMQLIDITHGPLDRGFGIAQLKLVTAAASTGVVIPGLKQDAAEQLRDTLVDVAESRRTGL